MGEKPRGYGDAVWIEQQKGQGSSECETMWYRSTLSYVCKAVSCRMLQGYPMYNAASVGRVCRLSDQ